MVQETQRGGTPHPAPWALSRPQVTAVVYAEDAGLLRLIVDRLPPSETEAVVTRGAFASRLRAVRRGVVGIGEASLDAATWLSRIVSPYTTLVVVSRLTPDNARRLGPLQSDGIQILWLEELTDSIRVPSIDVPPDPLRAFAEQASSGPNVCPMIRRALQLICCSDLPPNSVRSMSARLGVAPTTFRYHWDVGLGHGLSPKELIQWATLVRAVELRSRRKWISVAHRLGVHPRTLERLSHRLMGHSLGGLTGDPAAAARAFRQRAEAAF